MAIVMHNDTSDDIKYLSAVTEKALIVFNKKASLVITRSQLDEKCIPYMENGTVLVCDYETAMMIMLKSPEQIKRIDTDYKFIDKWIGMMKTCKGKKAE